MSQKVSIKPDVAPGDQIYSNLDPVVDFLLAHGNSLDSVFRWGSTKDGYMCRLKKDIDFEMLEKQFDFPSTVHLLKNKNTVYCDTTRCMIIH